MLRRQFLALAGLGPIAAAAPAPKTNFILILIDDLGWADLGCYGGAYYETPNLDRMAAEGVRFTDAYAACPVCSPTRAAVMTGKYPARLHITDWIPGRKQWPTSKLKFLPFENQLPLAETTIAETLKPLGYATASIGKWHLGAEPFYPDKQGFDLNAGGTERGSPPSYFPPYNIPGLKPAGDDEYLTDCLSRYAEDFIERNKDRPFFLYLPHFTVHLPYGAKKKLIEHYQAKLKPGQLQDNPTYAAMVHGMDEAVGMVLKKVKDLKLQDRTIVFFTSDNGGLRFEGSSKRQTTHNAPLRAGKGHTYEGGIRVCSIAWGAGIRRGITSNALACSIDFLPTMMDFAGAGKPPAAVDGISLKPLLTRGTAPRRDTLFWHYPHYSNQGGVPSGAVRQGDWKLIEFYEDARLELYNLKDDVGETRNLVKRNPDKAAALHKLLKDFRTRTGASMPESNPAYDPAKADQGLTGAEKPTPPS
jgi:arylsulfatase A-like enzyme